MQRSRLDWLRRFGGRPVLIVMAVAVVVLALAACGGGGSSSTEEGPSAEESTTASSSGGGEEGGEKAPISIGQVGAYSGAIPGLAGQGYGLEAWVKTVNEKGGVDGHEIELHKGDSKGEPTTEVSQVTQIATNDHAVAFAGMGTTSVAGFAQFLESKGIPTIGGNTNDFSWETNAGFYNPGTGFIGTLLAGYFSHPEGKDKMGLVYCKESPGCTAVYDLYKMGFPEIYGGKGVYAAEVSLSAPSFTAQCLAAKQAGVETLAIAMDAANIIRMAKDCAKQGYHPAYALAGTNANNEIAETGLFEGAIAGQSQAPWFLEEGPIAEETAAMEKFFPEVPNESQTVSGWAAGVALGKAIENAIEANPELEEISSEDILEGLGMIKDETFEGLTPPVTFTSEGVQEDTKCAFPIVVKNKEWVQEETEPVCPPASAEPILEEALEKVGTSE
ncbi:MAG: ABC transporter substrate-binding protein [Solirubrobacterales bacterium]